MKTAKVGAASSGVTQKCGPTRPIFVSIVHESLEKWVNNLSEMNVPEEYDADAITGSVITIW